MNKEKYIYNACVMNVVDGDTIDVNMDLGFNTWIKTRVRLHGINAPEKNDTVPENRERARAATEFVKESILNEWVTLETFKKDKFGQYHADVYHQGVNLNRLLLAEGHAVPAKD